MQQARAAAILVSDAPDADKLAAIQVIQPMANQAAIALLAPVAIGSAGAVADKAKEAIAAMRQRQDVDTSQTFEGADLLTRRELEVLKEITEGASNKEAGRTLGISP